MVDSYRDLEVWQVGMALVEQVYAMTEQLPPTEMYGLSAQLRRAVVSIPSNIAEGKAVGGQSYCRHLRIALGSQSELQTQLELARRLNMIGDADYARLMERSSQVGRMLAGLLRSLPKN
ncbi:MAG TPA: four helix bundle protein [Vicinamibacterales bacterium]|nr:four helix bundle protein [Vicinamibacterales bacterium]